MPDLPYAVRTTRAAEKDLRALRPWTEVVEDILLRLGEAPYQGEPLSGSLRDVRSLHFSLKGSGAYRAAYLVLEDEGAVLVFMVASRENFYAEAARRHHALRSR